MKEITGARIDEAIDEVGVTYTGEFKKNLKTIFKKILLDESKTRIRVEAGQRWTVGGYLNTKLMVIFERDRGFYFVLAGAGTRWNSTKTSIDGYLDEMATGPVNYKLVKDD